MDNFLLLYGWYTLYLWIMFSLIVGIWSRRKGGSFIAGFIFSLLLSPLIAALIVAVRKPITSTIEKRALTSGTMKRCPYCAELTHSRYQVSVLW